MNRPDLVDKFSELISELAKFHNITVEEKITKSIRETLDDIFCDSFLNKMVKLLSHKRKALFNGYRVLSDSRPDVVDGIMDLVSQNFTELDEETLRKKTDLLKRQLNSVFLSYPFVSWSGPTGTSGFSGWSGPTGTSSVSNSSTCAATVTSSSSP